MVIKCPYEKPRFTYIGDVTALTKAAGSGALLDASFPAGTKKEDLGWCSHCS